MPLFNLVNFINTIGLLPLQLQCSVLCKDTWGSYRNKVYSSSLHQIGLKKVFKMASLLGITPEVTIVGIVPKDYQSYRIGLSQEVEEAIPCAMKIVLQEVASSP